MTSAKQSSTSGSPGVSLSAARISRYAFQGDGRHAGSSFTTRKFTRNARTPARLSRGGRASGTAGGEGLGPSSGLKNPSETGTTLPPLYWTMRIVGWMICGAAGGADFLDSSPPMKTFSPSMFLK